MRKKRLLALCMAVGMTISSVLPAYASENVPIATEYESAVEEERAEIVEDDSLKIFESEIESENNGMTLNAVSDVITLTLEPYAVVNYGYSESAEEKTIRYVSSLTDSEYYYADYWGEKEYKSKADACKSMALSYIGIDLEPKYIENEIEDAYYFKSSLEQAMDRYINGDGKYSPPIMDVSYYPYENFWFPDSDYIVILGQKSENEYLALSPEDDSLLNVVIDGKFVRYIKAGKTIDGWYSDRGRLVMQYGTETTEVVMEDEALRAAVKSELSLTDDESITLDRISNMTSLEVSGNVTSLKGLEYADSLKYLTVKGGNINDLSPLNNNEELREIELYDNQAEDISFLGDFLENDLECDIYLCGEGKTIENAFKEYTNYDSVTALKNTGVLTEEIVNVANLYIEVEYESSNEDVADIEAYEYGAGNNSSYELNIKNQTGESTISAKAGSAEKQFTVTVVDAPEEIPEEEEIEEFPEIVGSEHVMLYQGKLWVLSEDGVQNLSEGIKVKDFVERNSEIALLDENNILYYYPHEENSSGYGEPIVIGKVKELCRYGYIDQNGTYHIWYRDNSSTDSLPQDIQTIDNVKTTKQWTEMRGKATQRGSCAIILEDGTSIAYCISDLPSEGYSYYEHARFDIVAEKIFGLSCYVLDNTNCFWKTDWENSNSETKSLIKQDENVSDISNFFYLKEGNCYSIQDKSLVKENVDALVYNERTECSYVVSNSNLYQAETNYDGEWEFTLYAQNYEKMVGEDFVLTKDGELWKGGTESDSSYKIMTSVKDVRCDVDVYFRSNPGVCILRTDGTVWTYSSMMPELVLEYEEPEPTPTPDPSIDMEFTDVRENDWYYDSVSYVNANGLMTGLNSTIFGPGETLSRAQFAVILHRMNDTPEMTYLPTFPDVPAGYWFTDAVLWANKANIVTGYSNGYFGTSDAITREQMALMMYRYANYKGYDTSVKADFGNFKDAACVSSFASEAMKWAVGNGIITGKDNGTMIDPQGNAARAECATIIMRFLEKYEN